MDTLKDSIEFDHHIRIVPVENTSVGLKGYIAIHRKIEGQPSLGATRLWKYEKDSDALDDALRLAHLMSYKSMASGFSYGGAKATLIYPEGGIQDKHAYFKAYTNYVNELHGDFVTGSDVGMSPEDVQLMSSFSPYIVGSNVRSNYFTSLGVLYAIQVVLQDMFDSPDVSNRTFAIQGVGNTGSNLLRLLIKHGAKNIYISDINEEVLKKLQHEFPFLIIIPTQDIHKQKVDVFSPCALSHAINTKTIHELDCLAIVGSANNQLESRNMGDMLHEKGIIYVPDYIANSGGLISVADQYEHGEADDNRIVKKLDQLKSTVEDLILRRKKDKEVTHILADKMMEERLSALLN